MQKILLYIGVFALIVILAWSLSAYKPKPMQMVEHFKKQSPPPPPDTVFPSMITPFKNTGCSVYFTAPDPALATACDAGAYDLNDNEIDTAYNDNKTLRDRIKSDKNNSLKDKTCKLTMYDGWKIGMDSSLIMNEPARGDPLSWAYCFKPIGGNENMQTLQNSMADTKSVVLHPTLLADVFKDGLSYARLAFKDFNYNNIKQDICSNSNLNILPQDTIEMPKMVGFTPDLSTKKIKEISLYMYDKNSKTMIKIMKEDDLINTYSKLFGEYIKHRELTIQPKKANADIYVFKKNLCGFSELKGTVKNGTLNLAEFKFGKKKNIFTFPKKFPSEEAMKNELQRLITLLDTTNTLLTTTKKKKDDLEEENKTLSVTITQNTEKNKQNQSDLKNLKKTRDDLNDILKKINNLMKEQIVLEIGLVAAITEKQKSTITNKINSIKAQIQKLPKIENIQAQLSTINSEIKKIEKEIEDFNELSKQIKSNNKDIKYIKDHEIPKIEKDIRKIQNDIQTMDTSLQTLQKNKRDAIIGLMTITKDNKKEVPYKLNSKTNEETGIPPRYISNDGRIYIDVLL